MTERNRATTTLRLRTPTQVQVPGSAPTGAPPPRAHALGARPGFEPRRQQVHVFAPRRDPTSDAILAELAALGLAEADDTDKA